MSSSIWPVLLAAVLLSGCGSLHNSQPQKNTHSCGPNAPALIQPAQVPATAAQYIACASNIDLEMYELGNPVLIGDLIAAHRRGASVKVLLDATERQSAFSGKQLAAAGIPMRYVHVPGGIDHIKLLVVDGGSAVLTGGINWGSDSTYTRDLDVLLPGDPSAAAVFSADWKAGSSGKPNEPTSSGAITGTFILSRMEDAIHVAPAGSTVEIAANYLTDWSVQNALAAAAKRGVRVETVLNRSAYGAASAAEWLTAHGVQVRWAPTSPYLHAKILLTPAGGMIGSANFSNDGLKPVNRELDVILPASLLPGAHTWFASLWRGSAPFQG